MNLGEARSLAAKLRQRYVIFRDLEDFLSVAAQYEGAKKDLDKVYAERERIEAEIKAEEEIQRAAREKTQGFHRLVVDAGKEYDRLVVKRDSEQAALRNIHAEVERGESYFDSLKSRIVESEAKISDLTQQIDVLTSKREEVKKEIANLAKRFSTDG